MSVDFRIPFYRACVAVWARGVLALAFIFIFVLIIPKFPDVSRMN